MFIFKTPVLLIIAFFTLAIPTTWELYEIYSHGLNLNYLDDYIPALYIGVVLAFVAIQTIKRIGRACNNVFNLVSDKIEIAAHEANKQLQALKEQESK